MIFAVITNAFVEQWVTHWEARTAANTVTMLMNQGGGHMQTSQRMYDNSNRTL
jgi:hypothetical protein